MGIICKVKLNVMQSGLLLSLPWGKSKPQPYYSSFPSWKEADDKRRLVCHKLVNSLWINSNEKRNQIFNESRDTCCGRYTTSFLGSFLSTLWRSGKIFSKFRWAVLLATYRFGTRASSSPPKRANVLGCLAFAAFDAFLSQRLPLLFSFCFWSSLWAVRHR